MGRKGGKIEKAKNHHYYQLSLIICKMLLKFVDFEATCAGYCNQCKFKFEPKINLSAKG